MTQIPMLLITSEIWCPWIEKVVILLTRWRSLCLRSRRLNFKLQKFNWWHLNSRMSSPSLDRSLWIIEVLQRIVTISIEFDRHTNSHPVGRNWAPIRAAIESYTALIAGVIHNSQSIVRSWGWYSSIVVEIPWADSLSKSSTYSNSLFSQLSYPHKISLSFCSQMCDMLLFSSFYWIF